MDQSLFAAPHGLSQRITSFIACACQGIHQLPLIHLIVLIANAHHLLDLAEPCPSRLRSKGCQIDYPDKPEFAELAQRLPFTTAAYPDAINVFDLDALLEPRRAVRLHQILRPASRDKIRWCAVRQHQSNRFVRGFFERQKSRRSEDLQAIHRPNGQQPTCLEDRLPTLSNP